jgi:beta-N-acetylhexosaminidase
MKFLKTNVIKSIVILILCIFLLPDLTWTFQSADPETPGYRIDAPDQSWVDQTLAGLSLREKIGQLILIRTRGEFLNRHSDRFMELKEAIQQYRVGGVVHYAGNIYESAVLLNELQFISHLPLLVSADFERGVSFRIEDTTSFPWTMAIGATRSEEFAYQEGKITARESRALGVHWLLAPVMDVNNNPENPVINIRSFGEDPQLVARLGSAFIRGARAGGALTTAKHFPGHGDTATDTHIGLAVVPSDLNRLNSMELVPFKSAIEAGVDAIMTAHVSVPKVTGDPVIPATLSKEILADLLRGTLQFEGIIVTDAMEMGAITNTYWCGLAAVRAIEAGADIVMLPTDVNVAVNEIERAVEMGYIAPEQIDRSVEKILKVKSSLGLHRKRAVSINRLTEVVASPQNLSLAQEIADHSITALKNESGLLPVNPVENPRIYSLVLDSGLATSPGSDFQSEMRSFYPSLTTEWANDRVTSEQIQSIERNAARSDLIVCSTIARLSSGRDISAIPKDQRTIMEKLIKTGKPLIWIAFGNPYVLERFPKVGTYLCTFSGSDVSQRAAARAVSGAIPITGKMPVSIPGYAAAGDGLQLPKLDMELKPFFIPLANFVDDIVTDPVHDLPGIIRQAISSYTESGLFIHASLTLGQHGSFYDFRPLDRDFGQSSFFQPWNSDYWDGSESIRIILSAMLATESGGLLLDAPVQEYLPEQRDTGLGEKTVADLLSDISGKSRPNPRFEVSNTLLIEEIVSRASGIPIDRMIEDPDLFSFPFTNTAVPRSAIHFPPIPPHYGYGSILRNFSQTLINTGIYNHRRIFRPGTISRFTDPGNRKNPLGWMKPDKKDWTGRFLSDDAYGYTDPSGYFLWIDPQKELFIILLASVGEQAEEAEILEAYEKIAHSILDKFD